MPEDAVGPASVVKLIRGWLDSCNKKHACIDCSKSLRATDRNPTWVIDAHQKCIVRGVDADRYLALSYVWPENTETAQTTGVQHIQLDQARLLQFQTPGSLEDPSTPFPEEIRDAIELTKMIGERYLWVDRFCIVQDADDTTSEVMRMDQIYSGAYLTIICGGNHGLFMEAILSKIESQNSSPFSMSTALNKIYPNRYWNENATYQIRAHYFDLAKSKWATRGWTYQEQILSKRSIVFLEDAIFWECDRSVWDGHTLSPKYDGPPTSESAEMGKRLTTLRWPDYSLYIDLVCLYNHRDFSYQQDAFVAMSGIFNILEPVYPGGFIWGLPSTFLDHSLLWQPLQKAKRRVGRPKGSETSTSDQSPPSWSWCGWQCLVDPWSLRSGLSSFNTEKHQEIAATWRTSNLLTWSTTTPAGDERVIHEPSKFDEQALKVLCSGNGNASSKSPLTTVETPVQYSINGLSGRLRCTMTRAFFRPAAVMQAAGVFVVLGAPKVSAFEHPLFTTCPKKEEANSVLVLQDKHGQRSGLIRLMHDEEDYDRLGQIEMIAISEGSCSIPDMVNCFEQQAFHGRVEWPGTSTGLFYRPTWLHETLRPDEGVNGPLPRLTLPASLRQGSVTYQPGDTCHYYNVLWIERKDGIAYRRACGRILKPLWEQSVCGNTEVTLG